jgi:hypothetical protein
MSSLPHKTPHPAAPGKEVNVSNVHTPQRGTNESFDAYKSRRAQSHALVKTMRRGPRQAPAINQLDVSRFWLGLHKATDAKRLRRICVKLSGIRQHKREQRAAASHIPDGFLG